MKEYIEREAAIKEIKFVRSLMSTESEWLHGYASGLGAAVDALVDAPTIETEPVKRGRWLKSNLGWLCSECATEGSPQWKRCPLCEAKMNLEDQQ